LHRLARSLSLTGTAGNDDEGVWCEIQGRRTDLDEFEARVTAEAPPLARVDSVRSAAVPSVEGEREFLIAPSTIGSGTVAGTVPPDIAACAACLIEIADPGGRRYRYAFTCCTDCGPRYTIVRSLPYDRERTSMAGFELCEACEAEYRDPADRRHHAQAVCCSDCGPALSLKSVSGEPVAGDPMAEAAALLRAGRIVAVKGLGGYQLACRADDSGAVARLRRRKHREEKPFALLVASVDAARELVDLDHLSVRALTGPETPIVLAPRRESAPVAAEVAPDTRLLGVMLPATPLHTLLIDETGLTLVCTSGNRSEEPIVTDDARVGPELATAARELVADGGPEIIVVRVPGEPRDARSRDRHDTVGPGRPHAGRAGGLHGQPVAGAVVAPRPQVRTCVGGEPRGERTIAPGIAVEHDEKRVPTRCQPHLAGGSVVREVLRVHPRLEPRAGLDAQFEPHAGVRG